MGPVLHWGSNIENFSLTRTRPRRSVLLQPFPFILLLLRLFVQARLDQVSVRIGARRSDQYEWPDLEVVSWRNRPKFLSVCAAK